MQQLEAKVELECFNLLGEAPMWQEVESKLFWLDINGKKLWSYSPSTKESKSWDLPEVAGSFAFREDGGFLMGFTSGLSFYDPETGASEKVKERPFPAPPLIFTRQREHRMHGAGCHGRVGGRRRGC